MSNVMYCLSKIKFVIFDGLLLIFMTILQVLLVCTFFFLIWTPEVAHPKIVDFSSDNPLFHPFVQKIKNYRSKDYLIKLLKRNLEEKLRKNRKRYDENEIDRDGDKFQKNKCECNCKCRNCRNFHKRCGHCENQNQESETENYKSFTCQSEGSFVNPQDCRQFYICFHTETDPIEVTCPKGFAFDPQERKCTRKAARHCFKKHIDKN